MEGVRPHSLTRFVPANASIFASDGPLLWSRQASSLVAFDVTSGAPSKVVNLCPAPFGLFWKVERCGPCFIVRDDAVVAAYDAETGTRLWSRNDRSRASFVGEVSGRFVTVGEIGDDLSISLVDIGTGEVEERFRLAGTMRYIGRHATLHESTLHLVTEQRQIFSLDVASARIRWQKDVVADKVHPLVDVGGQIFFPFVIETAAGSVTRVHHVDPDRGDLTLDQEIPGDARQVLANDHAMFALLEGARGRTPFGRHFAAAWLPLRNQAPLMIAGSGHAAASGSHFVLKSDDRIHVIETSGAGLNLSTKALPRSIGSPLLTGSLACMRTTDGVLVVDLPPPKESAVFVRAPIARHDIEASGDGAENQLLPPKATPRRAARSPFEDGLSAMLLHTDTTPSRLLADLALLAGEDSHARWQLDKLGLLLRDPRTRWSARPGRDPSLIDFALSPSGTTYCFYDYPLARGRRGSRRGSSLPVVELYAESNHVRWLAPDFDQFFAAFLEGKRANNPGPVGLLMDALGLPSDFPRATSSDPPDFFLLAHAAPETNWVDVEEARQALDLPRRERLLISLAANGGEKLERIAQELREVYDILDWPHHLTMIKETWGRTV